LNRFDFFKETYFKEIERKTSIDSSLSIPIGIITIEGTVLSHMLLNFNYKDSWMNSVVFIVFILAAFVFLAITICRLIRTYHIFNKGRQYKYLPFSQLLNDYYANLGDYYEKVESDGEIRQNKLDNDYEDYLIRNLVECNKTNAELNDKKLYHLFLAKQSLIISILTVFICLFPYGYNYFLYSEKGKPTKIQIKNPIEISNYPEYIIITKKNKKESIAQLWRNQTTNEKNKLPAKTSLPKNQKNHP
jgi:cbb3-type cytochrome oxidase subunit 3